MTDFVDGGPGVPALPAGTAATATARGALPAGCRPEPPSRGYAPPNRVGSVASAAIFLCATGSAYPPSSAGDAQAHAS